MKKFLAVLSITSLMSSGFASTVDSRTVTVQNNEQTDSFSLNTVTTRTEYRTEVVQSTCYREEIVGYERVCDRYLTLNETIGLDQVGPHPAPRPPRDPRDPPPERKPEPRPNPRPTPVPPHPRPDPYPRPEPRPIPRCYDRPIYRTVAYSCLKTISVPYEVVDHQSVANVGVRVSAAPASKPQTGNCGINFSLNGDFFQAVNSCAQYLAMATVSGQDNGRVKNFNYDVKLFDAEAVLAPLAGGLQDLRIDGDVLYVRTGDLNKLSNFTLNLMVQRKRFLKDDIVLINRPLNRNEYSYQAIDTRAGTVRIDLSKLIDFESDKKNEIKLDLNVTLPEGTVINSQGGLPALHQHAEITSWQQN